MNIDHSKKTIVETSFDLLDWKNGSLTGNGLKQAVDMFKAQDADKLTVIIYDRKTSQIFNIVDVNIGSMYSGHCLEIDIDTSKAILKEGEDMKDNEKSKGSALNLIKKAWDEAGAELKNIKTVDELKKKINDRKTDIKKAIDAIEDPKLKKRVEELNAQADTALSTLHEGVGKNTAIVALKLFAQILLCLVKLTAVGIKISGVIATLLIKGIIKVGKGLEKFADKKSAKLESEVNEASDTFDWAADSYGKGNSETYTWKVFRKIFPNLQFSMISQQGPGGWPEIKVSGKDRDVKRFMEWWNSAPTKDNKFWKKIMTALEKIYGKPLYDESDLNEADDSNPLSHALDAVGVKASTANSKSQDEVQMTATDGDTYAGIDVTIDRDIDAAMEEIYK